MLKDNRRTALNAAKSAVSAFAKDPSETNAAGVQSAWEKVRDLQAVPIWQQQAEAWLQSDQSQDDDLTHVIQQALGDARIRGRDYVGQTELAVRAVRQVRPDMSASDALAAVRPFQQS
jgi:hypothetical protein